jgi:predicted nucleic-acid-binding protein
MIGLDTNVLLRYLVQDDARQADQAERFLATACFADDPAFINRIVLCELVWMLESGYRYPRARVASALETIFRTRQFVVEDAQEAWTSLAIYRDGGDFSDALIAAVNLSHGCTDTATFDRRAARHPGFRPVAT